ncbi:MAG: YtxH domain-containing protein [Terriglobales bacterium]
MNSKDWVRLAAKLSLLFTEPKVRAAVGNRIKDSVGDLTDTVAGKYSDVSETVASKYEDAADRIEAATDALRGQNYWPPRVVGFLLGVGVGAGLGILLAPASGSETRESLREKAADVTADVTKKIRRSVTNMPSTGTEG